MDQQPPYDPDSYLQQTPYDPNQYAQQPQQQQYNPNQYAQQPQQQQYNPNQYAQQPQQQQYYDPNQYAQQPQQQQYYDPNQYTQQQYNQNQYPQQYNPQPVQKGPDDGGKNSNTANIMCVISLVCMYVIPVVAVLVSGGLTRLADKNESITSMFASAASLLLSASGLAAWVLMIIVRVKYPKNVFGKVLMWLYLIMLVMGVIGVIILFVACINTLRNCPG